MKSPNQTFKKAERLCSRKKISGLFESGNYFYTTHFKIIWDFATNDQPFPVQVMFSVSKRNFRHAVHRNLIKRRMREAYRKQKYILYEHLTESDLKVAFIALFIRDKIENYSIFETETKEILETLITSIKGKVKIC